MKRLNNLLLVAFLPFAALLFGPASYSQQVARGTPAFGSFSGGPDIVNNGNLNVHLTIPVLQKPGRGMAFAYGVGYDSSIWYPAGASGNQTWLLAANAGWFLYAPVTTGMIQYSVNQFTLPCNPPSNLTQETVYQYSNWSFTDLAGTRHLFSVTEYSYPGGCPYISQQYPTTSATQVAPDGSGYTLTATGSTGSVWDSRGTLTSTSSANITDRNGNYISNTGSTFTDTLGATALSVSGSGTPASPLVFTYTPPAGGSPTYQMKYTSYPIQTNFGCSGITDYGTNGTTTANLVSEIDLPDGTKYSFNYESTPQKSGFITGRIQSITLPSGGSITYTYTGGSSGNINCSDGTTIGLQRAVSDGVSSNTWTYVRTQGSGNQWTTLLTTPIDPANSGVGNDTAIVFQKDSATSSTYNFYPTQVTGYQGSQSGNVVLQTSTTCYNTNTANCTTTAVSSPITQTNAITSLPVPGAGTVQSERINKYDSYGNSTEVDEYAFGSGAPPSTPYRKTTITYASLSTIHAFRQQVSTYNGSGTLTSQTNYNYDETTPVAAPTGTPHLSSISGSRGNLTSIQRCTVLSSCGANYVKTIMTYDTAGQLQSVKDPLNNTTTYSYADSFFDDSTSSPSNPPAGHAALGYPTDAFITTITPPLNSTAGTLKFGYYFYNGALASSTDQNANSSYAHFDSIGRPSSAYGPTLPIAGGTGSARPWTSISYTSSTQIDTFTDINDSSTTPLTSCPLANFCRQDEVKMDGLGRTLHQYLVSDPEGQTTVDTVYDALGRVQNASHPYRNTSEMTYGVETPTYDALGHTVKVLHPDNTSAFTYYGSTVSANGGISAQLCSSSTYGLGFPVLFVDESGRKRQIWTDGLGRTIEGDEPDGTGALTSSVCYSYDPLDNLLQVVHSATPSQTRTYAYDPLSRVTSITIPERAAGATNCAVTFTYDSNSNLKTKTIPAPNQNASCTSGAVTISYSYDALNRLTGKTYSDSSPAVKYGYDATAITGCPTTTTPPTLTDSNPKSRMTAMCDSSGATSWAHDAAGRIITEKRSLLGSSGAVTQTISYAYNLDGSINTITYPSGKQVTYSVGNAQRYISAKDPSTGGAQYAWTASYAAMGALQSMITGQVSGGFAGITESHTYNQSLEYTGSKASSTAGTAMDLNLAYSLTTGDNGSVTTITNNQDAGRTQTLSYDPLNRILKAVSQAASGSDCWGQTFGPDGNSSDDALGNFYKMNSGTQANPPCPFNMLSVTMDGNNHVTGTSFAYDAVGNMIGDGQSGATYTFDDEGRLIKATSSGGPYCYVYDGNGLRVAKIQGGTGNNCSGGTVFKLYWRSLSGDSLAETDGSGSLTNTAYIEYVFFTGRRIASRVNVSSGASPNVSIFYYFADQLGSTRTITTGSGKNADGSGQTPGLLCYDQDYTPYGQEVFTTAQMTRLQATACPTNYKFTGYERDESGLDYAFARYYSSRLGRFLSTDPISGSVGILQAHNAYAYTSNNPLNLIDPTGMNDCAHTSGDCGGVTLDGERIDTYGSWFGRNLFGYLTSGDFASPCPTNDCTLIRIQQGGGGVGIVQQLMWNDPIWSENHADDGTLVSMSLQIGYWGWKTTGYTDNTPVSWWGTFFQNVGHNFASRDYWKSELGDGGCLAVFGEGFNEGGSSHLIDPLTQAAGLPPNIGPDDVIKQLGASGALAYQMSKGLTVPLRSSVYRGILQSSVKLGGAVAAVDLFARSAEGIVREVVAIRSGNCH